jgi:GT2 family glycosyltransferase
MVTAVSVHLITILYRSAESLPAFLDCLQAQDLPDWRLIAIDNASPDDALDILARRADGRVTVLRNPDNLGFARAANQGLRAAMDDGGDFAVLINNDTVFERDFLRRFVAARDMLRADVIAPRIMRIDQPEQSWYAGGYLDRSWAFINIHDQYNKNEKQEPREVEFATGCCLGLTRSVLERVGLLDESFFVYWEDTDFCLRLKKSGVPISYVPEPSLSHEGGAASGGEFSPSYIRLYYRSYMQILRKHFGMPHALRTMARILLKESGRREVDGRRVRNMAWSMLRGMVAPLVAQARLRDGGSPPANGPPSR